MEIVFTIVAKNYIGLANVLAKSVTALNKNIKFFVFIADELEETIIEDSEVIKYLVAKDCQLTDPEKWNQMAFKYNLTEFCTAIKPLCFKYLINQSTDNSKIIYFDPDILVFSNLKPVFDELENNFITLTPHILTMQEQYLGQISDQSFLGSGIYNLGFIGIRVCSESIRVINWWTERLSDKCYIDLPNHLFTDQKWMNFLPSFFESGVIISHDLGRNIAPWNYFERKLIEKNGQLFVTNRIQPEREYPLLFSHFSGFNYKNILSKQHKEINLENENYKDLDIMFKTYSTKLDAEDINTYMPLKYTYDYFSNGDHIKPIHRRIFRRLIELDLAPINPFNTAEDFYKNLFRNRLLSKKISKIDANQLSSYSNKILIVNKISILLFKIIGLNKYVMLCKFFERYFKLENQVHLYDRKIGFKGFKKN
jgi:hypothetical protein